MKTTMLLIATAALLASCGSDNNTTTSQLTFKGNGNAANGAVFNGPHAGDTVRAALLDGATVLDIQKATIAATGTDPAFSFTFAPAIDTSKAYTVNYWIDSNFQTTDPVGGDKCGAVTDDHQWSVPIPAGQTTFTDVHRPTSTTNVCSTFTFQLTFVADSTYVGPHSGQPYKLALVHGSDTTAEEILSGTVGTTVGQNAISAQFSEKLVIGEPYTVKVWIDSNFGLTPPAGQGVCDPKANDHQWSFAIPNTLASHPATFTAPAHSGATTVDVCSFFP